MVEVAATVRDEDSLVDVVNLKTEAVEAGVAVDEDPPALLVRARENDLHPSLRRSAAGFTCYINSTVRRDVLITRASTPIRTSSRMRIRSGLGNARRTSRGLIHPPRDHLDLVVVPARELVRIRRIRKARVVTSDREVAAAPRLPSP